MIDIVETLPVSPSKSDAYILKNGNNYSIQVFDGVNWQQIEINFGEIYKVTNLNNFVSFDENGYNKLFSQDVLNIDALPLKSVPNDNNNLVLSDGDLKK